MKTIFTAVVRVSDEGKRSAFVAPLHIGENIQAVLGNFHADVVHLCENKRQATDLASQWNESFKNNGIFGF